MNITCHAKKSGFDGCYVGYIQVSNGNIKYRVSTGIVSIYKEDAIKNAELLKDDFDMDKPYPPLPAYCREKREGFAMKNYKTYVPVHTKMFLYWFNNSLSLPCFAEHYGISTKKARQIIRKGEALHESNFGSILEWK